MVLGLEHEHGQLCITTSIKDVIDYFKWQSGDLSVEMDNPNAIMFSGYNIKVFFDRESRNFYFTHPDEMGKTWL
ncbi:hypothetical protein N8Z24_00060 [bacterium]|nr:hypothetical protein [bacterium]